ncbi:MAG: asparagine synthetase B, partial [Pseudomonadota bacterium]
MCGLAGFVDRRASRHGNAPAMEDQARRMAASLRHRGPDGSGVWVDALSGVGVGHQRLSIIDLSENGAQPMLSGNGRYVIAYNGEIYNYSALRAELERKGQSFRGHSDTEVLVEGFVCWGVKETL